MKKLAVILIILPIITGIRSCTSSPSSFFLGIDGNDDNQVSYQEWASHYMPPVHEHPIEECSRKDFYFADCNLDDHLSWKEYSDFRFKGISCSSPAVKTLRKRYEENADLQAKPKREDFENMIILMNKALYDRENFLKKKYNIEPITPH